MRRRKKQSKKDEEIDLAVQTTVYSIVFGIACVVLCSLVVAMRMRGDSQKAIWMATMHATIAIPTMVISYSGIRGSALKKEPMTSGQENACEASLCAIILSAVIASAFIFP